MTDYSFLYILQTFVCVSGSGAEIGSA